MGDLQLVQKRGPSGKKERWVESREQRIECQKRKLQTNTTVNQPPTQPQTQPSTQTPADPPPQVGIRRLWRGPLLRLRWSDSEWEDGEQILDDTDIPIALAAHFSGRIRRWFPQPDDSLTLIGPIANSVYQGVLGCSTAQSCARVLRWMIDSCYGTKIAEYKQSDFESIALDLDTANYLEIQELQHQLQKLLRVQAQQLSMRDIGELYRSAGSDSFASELLRQEALAHYIIAVKEPKNLMSYDNIRRLFRCDDRLTHSLMDSLEEMLSSRSSSVTSTDSTLVSDLSQPSSTSRRGSPERRWQRKTTHHRGTWKSPDIPPYEVKERVRTSPPRRTRQMPYPSSHWPLEEPSTLPGNPRYSRSSMTSSLSSQRQTQRRPAQMPPEEYTVPQRPKNPLRRYDQSPLPHHQRRRVSLQQPPDPSAAAERKRHLPNSNRPYNPDDRIFHHGPDRDVSQQQQQINYSQPTTPPQRILQPFTTSSYSQPRFHAHQASYERRRPPPRPPPRPSGNVNTGQRLELDPPPRMVTAMPMPSFVANPNPPPDSTRLTYSNGYGYGYGCYGDNGAAETETAGFGPSGGVGDNRGGFSSQQPLPRNTFMPPPLPLPPPQPVTATQPMSMPSNPRRSRRRTTVEVDERGRVLKEIVEYL